MSRILLVPDSFKHCLSAAEVCKALKEGILSSGFNLDVNSIPLSDGGEGILEVLAVLPRLRWKFCESADAFLNPIKSKYLFDARSKSAYLAISTTSGIETISLKDRNPELTCSFGLGLEILDALKSGAKHIHIFLGGSSSNDAGTGAAQALGFKFFNDQGTEINELNGSKLKSIYKIQKSEILDEFADRKISIYTDVVNRFYGTNGASMVFAKQKGADEEQINQLEQGMIHFQKLVYHQYHFDLQFMRAGAAGGVAGGLSFLLDAEVSSAFDFIAEKLDLVHYLQDADIVVTGEGRFDRQSLDGKLVGNILNLSNKYEKQVYLVCGTINNMDEIKKIGFAGVFIENNVEPLVTNPAKTYTYLKGIGKELATQLRK